LTGATDAVGREAGLHRELSQRQLTMIALGGAIGTGLFLGTTLSVGIAGPAVVVTYILGALIAWLMTLALGQLAARHPTAGSFGVHAEIYQGPWAGFTVRWTYWFCQTVAIGGEVVASGIYVQHWLPQLPLWVPVVLLSAGLVAVNAMHVGAFGRFEYWFAMIKVTAIVLFILFGLAILTGLRPADVPGASGYAPMAPMGWGAAWLALPVVMFSYLGTEIVAVTAGEAKDPERAIPRALRTTVVRLILFYVVSMALLMALVPWRQISPERSPFVLVFETIGVPGAASAMNFVVLTAALSAINTDIYLTSRMLFSLARSGDAPTLFGRLGRRGTPLAALLASAAGMAAASVLSKVMPGDAFKFLFGVSIFGGLYVWGMIFLTHLRYQTGGRRQAAVDGRRQAAGGREDAPAASVTALSGEFAAWRRIASAVGLVLMIAIIATTWWVPFMRVALLSGIPWLVLLTIAWRFSR
jgi:L-asparagine transporter-like permease